MASNTNNAQKIQDLAEELGCDVERHWAQTGTIYLTVTNYAGRRTMSLKLRFADHADAYANSDYTCDGVEGTVGGARAFLLESLGVTESHVRRLRRMRMLADARDIAARRIEWARGFAAQEGIDFSAALAKCEIGAFRAKPSMAKLVQKLTANAK